MTVYYVRRSGSDAADGRSPATAFATIGHALTRVAAGDTVYMGTGLYAGGQTLAVGGLAGQPIQIVGDVTGDQTGDPGLVCWSTATDLAMAPPADAPASVITLADVDYVTLRGLTILGGSREAGRGVVHITCSGILREVAIEDCYVAHAGPIADADAIYVDYTAAAQAPETWGLRVDRCLVLGRLLVEPDENEAGSVDLKYTVRNTLFLSRCGAIWLRRGASAFYSANGIRVAHCTCIGGGDTAQIRTTDNNNAATPIELINCLFLGADVPVEGQVVSLGGNVCAGSDASAVDGFTRLSDAASLHPRPMIGGAGDALAYQFAGASPLALWGPPVADTPRDFVVGRALTAETLVDLWGCPRGTNGWVLAQPTAVLDNRGWTDPEAINRGDPGRVAVMGAASMADSVRLGGVQVLGAQHGEITGVALRLLGWGEEGTAVSGEVWSANKGTRYATFTAALSPGAQVTADIPVPAPDGGWSWQTLREMEVVLWRSAGTGTAYLARLDFAVAVRGAMTAGAVEARLRPEHADDAHATQGMIRFAGPGHYEIWQPVTDTPTSVIVFVWKSETYRGDPPLVEVFNIPGIDYASAQADGSGDLDEESGWEPIVVNFTPTACGLVRIRLRSRDTSGDGLVYFDDLTVRCTVEETPQALPLSAPPPKSGESSPLFAPAPQPAVRERPLPGNLRTLRGAATLVRSVALPPGRHRIAVDVKTSPAFRGQGPCLRVVTRTGAFDAERQCPARVWNTLASPAFTLTQAETVRVEVAARGADATHSTLIDRWRAVDQGEDTP